MTILPRLSSPRLCFLQYQNLRVTTSRSLFAEAPTPPSLSPPADYHRVLKELRGQSVAETSSVGVEVGVGVDAFASGVSG